MMGSTESMVEMEGDIVKSAAEINVQRIEAIIVGYDFSTRNALKIARKIVEAFPELRSHQQTMECDGTSKPIVTPLPWKLDT